MGKKASINTNLHNSSQERKHIILLLNLNNKIGKRKCQQSKSITRPSSYSSNQTTNSNQTINITFKPTKNPTQPIKIESNTEGIREFVGEDRYAGTGAADHGGGGRRGRLRDSTTNLNFGDHWRCTALTDEDRSKRRHG